MNNKQWIPQNPTIRIVKKSFPIELLGQKSKANTQGMKKETREASSSLRLDERSG